MTSIPSGPNAAGTTTVLQAYQFALDPTRRLQGSLASHTGAARFAYNWGLDLVTTRMEQRKADPSVQVPWTLPELRREWNRAKDEVAPWWAENSKEAYNSGLDALARALKNWADSRSGRRNGRPMGFPRRKKKGHARDACRFTTGAIRILPDRKHVQLPRIGVVRTHESTRKLARRLEHGTARVLAATISRQADRWFLSFTVEVQRTIPAGNGKPSVVGVDVGVRHLAVLSTGQIITNPRAWNNRSVSFGGCTGSSPVARPVPDARTGRDSGWPASMPGWPTYDATRCTSSPPASPPSTGPW